MQQQNLLFFITIFSASKEIIKKKNNLISWYRKFNLAQENWYNNDLTNYQKKNLEKN